MKKVYKAACGATITATVDGNVQVRIAAGDDSRITGIYAYGWKTLPEVTLCFGDNNVALLEQILLDIKKAVKGEG